MRSTTLNYSVTFTPPLTVPSAPQDFSVSYSSQDEAIVLNWVGPNSNGGSAITEFNIYRGISSGDEIFLTSTTNYMYWDDNMPGGMTYYYYVTAVNAVGEGHQCSEESAYYTTSAPSYPIDITLNYISNSNAINVSWSLPTSDGGATISYYNVYRSTISGNEVFLAKAYSLTYIDTNVKNGQTYYYTVTAVNSIGEGSQSFQNYFTVPEVAPNAPQSLSLSASSGSITVSWSPPSNNGGETITGYDIYRGTTSGGETLLNDRFHYKLYRY